MLNVPSNPKQSMILEIFTKLCFYLHLSSGVYGDNQPGTSPPVSSHGLFSFSPAKAYVNCYNNSAKRKYLIWFSFICNYMDVIKLFQGIIKVKFSLSTLMVSLLFFFFFSVALLYFTFLRWKIWRCLSRNLSYSSCDREYELAVIIGKLEKAFPSCD